MPRLGRQDSGPTWSFLFASVSPPRAGWLVSASDKMNTEQGISFPPWTMLGRALSDRACLRALRASRKSSLLGGLASSHL